MAEEYGRQDWRDSEEAAQREALRRIAAAEANGADTLDLADLGALRALPPELARLTGLKHLYAGWRSAKGNIQPYHAKALSDIAALTNLVHLETLDLSSTRVSDLAALSGSFSLTYLDLSNTKVSDLTALSGLTSLTALDLDHTKVSDLTALSGLVSLTSLNLCRTRVSDLSALSGFLSLSSLDISFTSVRDLATLSNLTSLDTLDLHYSRASDLAFLLRIPAFAEERALSLEFLETPAADRNRDRRLYMLSRLDPQRCAIETIQYLKGTHPDFRDPPAGAAPAPLAERLVASSPVDIVARDGRLEAVNAGAPERLAPRELQIRVQALRVHLAQLLELATGKQVTPTVIKQLQNYQQPLGDDEPTYLLLDGPMAFLRGGCSDGYVTDGLDGGFVEGWRRLVKMHDELRPLLLPPEEDMPALPALTSEATPEAGQRIADQAIAVLGSDEASQAVGKSLVDALVAAKQYFDVARENVERRPGLMMRGMKAVGGIVSLVVNAAGFGSSVVAVAQWATTPQGQAIIALLQPILQAILRMFGG